MVVSMAEYTVIVPELDLRASPNKRLHYHALGSIKADQKETMIGLILAQGRPEKLLDPPVHLNIYFESRTKHRRDFDNMLASQKAYIDGTVGEIIEDDSADKLSISLFYKAGLKESKVIYEFKEVKQ